MASPQQQTYPGGLGYYAQADAERQASQRQQQGSQLEQAKQQAAQQVQQHQQQRDDEYEQARQQVVAEKAALAGQMSAEGRNLAYMQQRVSNPNAAGYGPLPMPTAAYADGGMVGGAAEHARALAAIRDDERRRMHALQAHHAGRMANLYHEQRALHLTHAS